MRIENVEFTSRFTRRNRRPVDVRAIRRRMRLTQRQFANCFGFPLATLRHWERGNRRPSTAALVMLHLVASNPQAVLRVVKNIRFSKPGLVPRLQPTRSWRAPPGYCSSTSR